jgi:diguanylate cyclase (GGDEF)-like protein
MVMVVRRSLLVVLAGATALLMVAIGSGWAGYSNARTSERTALRHQAAEQAQLLDSYFTRAESMILLTAHNPAFEQYHQQAGSREQLVSAGGRLVAEANDALAYLEELYPGRIGEACFIDATGAEIARVVRGERAPLHDLSLEEHQAPFFAPTFDLPFGGVYQSEPYLSPDTDEWVIANSTLVPDRNGVRRAIVHFEVTIESFRQQANARGAGDLLVVDARTGRIVIDSAAPQRAGAELGDPGDTRFVGLTGGWSGSGVARVGGRQVAYERITPTHGNANQWYAVSLAPAPAGPLTGIGVLSPTMAVFSLLLIGFAGFVLRRGQSALVRAANTDPLTGLANRRRLTEDLDVELGRATPDDPLLLVLCDLDGFKPYNDTFGHPAGDALLARLGHALAATMVGRGTAYRIGGDEFCILARPGRDRVDHTVDLAVRALGETGDGFAISASHGALLVPDDATTADEALRLVDLRMYERKTSGRVPADAQTANALLRALHERDPDLADRLARTADLAGAVCRRLGVPAPEEARIRQVAQLNDVGKVAVPDGILHKNGPLDPSERAFIRQTPTIGERITAAASSLSPVGPMIRSCREWYDGSGYPDGLAGEEIPLGARIVSACAAMTAMTSQRPYAATADIAAAVAELQRCAGSQFDPAVVDAIVAVVREPATA